jgi:SAM-dependent methyltransferase
MASQAPASPPDVRRLGDPAPAEYDASYAFYQEVGLAPRFSSGWWAAKFYTRLLRRMLPQGSAVLDFGCGMGNLLREFPPYFDGFGMDISYFGVRAAEENAAGTHVWVGDDKCLAALAPERFDAVVAKHVLEHIPDPARTVAAIARTLRPNGVFMMAVPNTESLLRRLKGPRWIGVKDPTHCSVLPPTYWADACREAGLRVERTFSDGFWDVPYIPWVPPLLQLPLFGCMAIVQVVSGWPFIPVRWGESFMLIARKAA